MNLDGTPPTQTHVRLDDVVYLDKKEIDSSYCLVSILGKDVFVMAVVSCRSLALAVRWDSADATNAGSAAGLQPCTEGPVPTRTLSSGVGHLFLRADAHLLS